MKAAPLSLFFIGILLGSASASATAYFLMRTDAHASRAAEAAIPGAPVHVEEDSELLAALAAIDTLRFENGDLRGRIEALENAPAPVVREAVEGYVSTPTFEAFEKEMRAALRQWSDTPPEPEEFKEQIAGALVEIRREEAFAKVRDYHEKREQRLEEDLDKIAEWLELSTHQVKGVRGVLLAQYERENEQRRLWEEGTDPEVLGELKRTDGEAFDANLQLILTEEQRGTFWKAILGGGK